MDLRSIVSDIKNWFDWTPVAVSGPVEVYRDYRDKGRVLLGYEVTVTYKYHGEYKYLFADDEDKLCMVSRAHAYNNAVRFCREKKDRIKQR